MRILITLAAVAGLAGAASAAAPKGATALCNDGSSYSGTSHRGACAKHDGVKQWLDTDEAQPAPRDTSTPKVKRAAPMTNAPMTDNRAANPPSGAAATGGALSRPQANTGDVWVNTETKVYHCRGDRWYGTTKRGQYMPEAQARAGGYHADHGKSCG